MPESKYALLLRTRGFAPCENPPLVAIVTESPEETEKVLEACAKDYSAIERILAGKLLYGKVSGIAGTFVRDELGNEWFSPQIIEFVGQPDFISSESLVKADLRQKMN